MNYDLVGNNTPVFFIRDAIKSPDFIHTQKRHPQTHLKNPNAVRDFWSLSPESLHQVTILMSDRGIPASLRTMNGYGSHTFKWVNEQGEGVWVKYHYTQAGDLYRLMSEEERARLVENIAEAMAPVESDEIKLRQISHFYKADPQYGKCNAKALNLQIPVQS